ncbi:hypothetical protein AZL_002990 [Azospirillum sp. B510]|uniref:hypothetical protein n=1 Tax=Azospirillum sp. (strain B510) TaxID=137722 RepID=UPI0001C4C34F|nr:hypothetical protein [Azospirillum sp. B510]BAI70937.1 hypothetical protein AZL_002990 [Azospirillum sp. B510]
MPQLYTEKQLDAFHQAAASLKLYSRSELSDESNRSIIEQLYVDPLPNDQVFKTLLADNTTLIIGRKGTGKSTIFQRAQHEIRKNKKNIISSYMDIRNVYEASQVDSATIEKAAQLNSTLPADEIKRLMLYLSFFRALISGIREDLYKQVELSFLSRLKERFMGSAKEIFSNLDEILQRLSNPKFESISGFVSIETAAVEKYTNKKIFGASLDSSLSLEKPSLSLKSEAKGEFGDEHSFDEKYANVMMRVVGINEIIDELKNVLDTIGVKYLYVFLDDFSELPLPEMKIVVNAIISPFTRWSEFIRFKIAGYPGRIYLGSLDKTKIEEVYLDIHAMYGSNDVSTMEEKSIHFTKRIVEKRLSYYCGKDAEAFFDTSSSDIWRTMFYSTVANPRILGHIMLYAYESNLLFQKPIGIKAIQEAAKRYYEEKVSSFFSSGRFRDTSFHERSSIYSLKELLEAIVSRSKELKNYKDSRITKVISGRTPSSHFFVLTTYDDLLTTLELSFFVTKYYEQSDRDGRRVSVYCLNYGLCEKFQIAFGRPLNHPMIREARAYFIERIFDYNGIIRAYLQKNQEIKCDSCHTAFDIDKLSALQMFGMKCPSCASGRVSVVNLSKKYSDLLDGVSIELLLPETELGMLQILHAEQRSMYASEIAVDLDCSGQLIGRRAKNLADRGLVAREQAGAVKAYRITQAAEAAYFSDSAAGELDVPND